MAFIKVSGKNHTDFPEVGILAWGETKQQSGVTSYHACRATVSSCESCLLLKMDQAPPPPRKRVHCFENHYGKLVQLSSLVCNSLIQKGLAEMHNFSSVQLGPCVAFVTVVLDGRARE